MSKRATKFREWKAGKTTRDGALYGEKPNRCAGCRGHFPNEEIAQDISVKQAVTLCHECSNDLCGTCSVCGDRALLSTLVNRLFSLVCKDCDYNDGESNEGDDQEYYRIAEGMQYD